MLAKLFGPFSPEMGIDTAFLERMHCCVPGEIPRYRLGSHVMK